MPKKAPQEIKGVTPVLKPLTDLSPYDGPYKDGIYPDRFGGEGWRTLRVEDEYADFTFALEAPDGTIITGKQAEDNSLSIRATKDGEVVHEEHLGADAVLRPSHFGEQGYGLVNAAPEHIINLVQRRNKATVPLRALAPGDWIDMFPLLTLLKKDGEMRVTDAQLSEAEDNKFLIEDVEREREGTVILYTDGGIYTFDNDLQSYEKYNLITIEKHEPKHGKNSMYPQPRRPIY